MKEGLFISFEGIDGSGKSTQAMLLGMRFASLGIPYVQTREPGGTKLGQEIRNLLFDRPDLAIADLAEEFFFQADRAQHFAEVVFPALADGKIVLCDRGIDSSVVYRQVFRQRIDELFSACLPLAAKGRLPDLTILLDIDPEQAAERMRERRQRSGVVLSHLDSASIAVQSGLRCAFWERLYASQDRMRAIEASGAPMDVHQCVVSLVDPFLAAKGIKI